MPRNRVRERKTKDLTFSEALELTRVWLVKRLGAPAEATLHELQRLHLATHSAESIAGTDLECSVLAVVDELQLAVQGDEGAPHVANLGDASVFG